MQHIAGFNLVVACIKGFVIDGEACPEFADSLFKFMAVLIDVVIAYDFSMGGLVG